MLLFFTSEQYCNSPLDTFGFYFKVATIGSMEGMVIFKDLGIKWHILEELRIFYMMGDTEIKANIVVSFIRYPMRARIIMLLS